jgi:hypothetical protein
MWSANCLIAAPTAREIYIRRSTKEFATPLALGGPKTTSRFSAAVGAVHRLRNLIDAD